MDHPDLARVLSRLGIRWTPTSQADGTWTLTVVSPDPDKRLQTATLNPLTLFWDLPQPSSAHPPRPVRCSQHEESTIPQSPRSRHIAQGFDDASWSDTLPHSEAVVAFRSVQWSTTPLGPLKQWPHALRLFTHQLFADPRPSAICWSPQRTTIYNDRLVPLLGTRHANHMGQCLQDVWPELIDSPSINIESANVGAVLDDYERFLLQDGFLEETWWRGHLCLCGMTSAILLDPT